MSSSDDESRVFVLQGHLPFEVKKIKELIGENVSEVKLSKKWIAMDRVNSLMEATNGDLCRLTIPNLTFLGARDADPLCTAPPSERLCSALENLSINCSFQPNAPLQVQALTNFIGKGKSEVLDIKISEHPTDSFLNQAEFLRPSDSAAIGSMIRSTPHMLHVRTSNEKQQALLNADGSAWGRACIEQVFGTQLPAPKVDRLEAAVESILTRPDLERIIDGPPRDLSALVPQTPPQQLLSPAEVRANAAAVMRQLDVKPKHQFMTADQWRSGIMVFLSTPLPRGLVKLTLQALFPPPPATIRVLNGLENLEILHLQYCDITDATLEALMPDLTHMPQLRVLDLERNRLTSRADLGPIACNMLSLETISVRFNAEAGGDAFNSLFKGITESGNKVLREIDLSYNNFCLEGIFFRYITGWNAESARLILPNVFSDEIVARLEALMPDGSTLCLEGDATRDGRAADPVLADGAGPRSD